APDPLEDHPSAVRDADAPALDELVCDPDDGDDARFDRRRERSDDADRADHQCGRANRSADPDLYLRAARVLRLLLSDLAVDAAPRGALRGALMDLAEFLRKHDIHPVRHEHPPVMTVEESLRLVPKFPGAKTKNLFLRDKKGRRHLLVTVPHDKAVDIDALAAAIGVNGLGFGSAERLS